MKHIYTLIAFFFIFTSVSAQLERVIVEKYYISDANDATDIQYITDINGNTTDTVILEEGSTTYRIYIQLTPGYMLTKVYGDANHKLIISSTASFYNNVNSGVSFGKDLNSSRLLYNTVALDSWLTLGQATRTHSGVLKSEDTDGSSIGGSNNKSGLLINDNVEAGIPLTNADGLMPAISNPLFWLQSGIINNAGDDSTIFGSLKTGKLFVSNNAFLQCSGVTGVNPDSSKVLIAQLTTRGEVSFELNIQVKKEDGSSTINYVAKRAPEDDSNGNLYNANLAYPHLPVCGCKDPSYMEFNSHYDCNNTDSCKTKIICGCMDPIACNFDPTANYSIQSLCCYPGLCGDRDISVVCPNLDSNLKSGFLLYPNPVSDQLNFEITSDKVHETKIEIYNSFGRLIWSRNIGIVDGTVATSFNMSDQDDGLYMARYYIGNSTDTQTFIKK